MASTPSPTTPERASSEQSSYSTSHARRQWLGFAHVLEHILYQVNDSNIGSRDRSTGIQIRLRAGRPMTRGSISGTGKKFLYSRLSRQALGRIQPPVQWV
jgi:hypothetical protein